MPTPKSNWVEGEYFTPAAANVVGQAIVDLQNGGAAATAAVTHAAVSKATPVDGDKLPLVDSAASFGLKHLTWANLKVALAAYYNSLTATLTNKTLTSPTLTSPVISGNILDSAGAIVLQPLPQAGANTWARLTNGVTPGGGVTLDVHTTASSTATFKVNARGNGGVALGDTAGVTAFEATTVTSGVNYVLATAAAAGDSPTFQSIGADTNIDLDLYSKGAGVVRADGIQVATTSDIELARAADNLSGGGLVSVSATYEVKWASRFLVISNGRSALRAAAGFWEISCPAAGVTITGVGGATSKVTTVDGIPMAIYDALYYILPLGSTHVSVPENFRLVNYTANIVVPSNWVFIALRPDRDVVFNRFTLSPSQSLDAARIQSDLNVGNTLVRRDTTGSFSAGTIAANALTVGGVAAVTTTAAQSLSNKTISGASNTLSNIPQSAVTSLTADLAAKQDAAAKGVANGYASLDGAGKLPSAQLPVVLAATVAVGSTTTGSAGSSAVVTNSGTSAAAVLNFTVPQGAVGPQGAPGTPGSVTIAGLGDATTIARRVVTTAQGGQSVENTSNTWAKLVTLSPPVNGSSHLILGVSTGISNQPQSAIISVYAYQGSVAASLPLVAVQILGMPHGGTAFLQDGFKLVNNGYLAPVELWIKKGDQYTQFNVTEISRSATASSVTYHDGAAWQSAEPVGSGINTRSTGVTVGGVPVVTTTGTATLTNKTLTSPTVTNGRFNALIDTGGATALNITPTASAANYLGIICSAAGQSSVNILAQGTDTNINMLLQPKGGGGVQVWAGASGLTPRIVANGFDANQDLLLSAKGTGQILANSIPVVTTTGAQTVTNKTISGASNTVTNLPASATPDASRLVRSHGTSANNWYKVVTFAPGATPFARYNAVLTLSTFNSLGAIVSVTMGNNAADAAITGSVEFLSKATTSVLNDNAFKIVNNGYGQPIELWVQTVNSNGSAVTYYESARYSNTANIAYDTSQTAVTTEPVGSAFNVRSTAPSVNGEPIVTTTGTATLTNKTLTNPKVSGTIFDTTNNELLEFVGNSTSVNHIRINNQPTTGSPIIAAAGDDANISLNLIPKGTGTVLVNGNSVGVRVAVPASAAATGASGQWAADNSWIYVCIASGTWRRAALSTW